MIQILFFLPLILSVSSQCTTTGFYDDNGYCSPCDPSCEECTGPNPSQCSSCYANMTFTANTCNCPASTYFNSGKKSCDSCHASCSTCDGPTSTDCLTCDLPSKYYQGKCLNCPFNSYVNSTGSCKACDISCYDCSDSSSTSCTACRNNMVLVSGQCQCPAGSFLHTTTYTCLPCYSACETCSGPLESQCLSCPSGLSLYKTACLCPSGTYYDSTMSSCIDCDDSCKECSGSASNQCKACNDGTYLKSGTCNICSAVCLTCSGGTSKDCTSCPEGKIMFNGQCLSQNGCHESCTQCIGPNADQCIFCKSPLLFIQGDLAGTCAESCPSASYVATENGRQECKSKKILRGSLSLGTDLNTYKITFNMDISSYYRGLIDIMSLDILLQAKQTAVTFTKTYSLGSNNKAIFISFSFDHDLLPSNILLVQFNNSKNTAENSYFMQDTLLQIEMQESTNYPESIQNMINAVSKINTAGSQGNGAFSLSSAFVLKSIHSMRSHFMESMIGYLVFLNVYYPPNFIKYATDMTNNDDDFSPNFFKNVAEAIENEVEQEKINQDSNSGRLLSNAIYPYNERYNGLVPSQVFIANLGAELTVFIISVLCLAAVEVTLKLIPEKYHKTRLYDFVLDTSRSLRYNFILNQMLSTYNDFALYGCMDVINVTDFRAAYGVYFLMAPCALILAFSGPFLFYYFMKWFFAKLSGYNHATNKELHPDYDTIKRFKVMIKPFKKNRMAYLLYHPLLMIRSLIFAISVVFAQNSPAFQVVINPLMSLGVLFYLLKWRPFKLRIQLFLSVIYELLYLIAAFSVVMLHFYTEAHMEDVQTRGNMAFVIMACSILMMAMDFISIFFEVQDMIRVYKKKKAQKKVAPLVKKLTPPGGLQSPSSQPMLSFNQNTMQASINNEKLLSDDVSDTQNDLSSLNEHSSTTPVKSKDPLGKKNSTFRSYVLNSLMLPGLVKSRKSSVWPELSSNPMSPVESDNELSQNQGPPISAADKRSQGLIEKDEGSDPLKGGKNSD